jgi:hypothetical protein
MSRQPAWLPERAQKGVKRPSGIVRSTIAMIA